MRKNGSSRKTGQLGRELPMNCERCHHLEHVGLCGVETEIQGIEQQCICVTGSERTTDRYTMRGDSLVKQAEVDFVMRREPKPARYPKRYRRM